VWDTSFSFWNFRFFEIRSPSVAQAGLKFTILPYLPKSLIFFLGIFLYILTASHIHPFCKQIVLTWNIPFDCSHVAWPPCYTLDFFALESNQRKSFLSLGQNKSKMQFHFPVHLWLERAKEWSISFSPSHCVEYGLGENHEPHRPQPLLCGEDHRASSFHLWSCDPTTWGLDCLCVVYSCPPLSLGSVFQDPQRTPETWDSIEPCIYHIFLI
jgi:hypothetical protein